MDLSIIIINYNTFSLTCQCVDSVIRFTEGLSYEIILVENGTGQFTEELVAQWGGIVRLILSEKNLGFAGGNNLGIQLASGTYVLLLNSDVYLKANSILLLWEFMKANNEVGAASPRLIYPDGRHQSIAQRLPSLKYALIEKLRLQKLMPRRMAGRCLLGAFFDHAQTTEVDWVWAAFMILPRKLIELLPQNKLDDTYFMYWEDVQWCLDIRNLGYKIYFFAETEAVHIHQGSNGKKSDYMRRNEELFMQRNYSRVTRFLLKILSA